MEREEALDKYKWDLKDIYPTQQDWDKDYEELMANVSRYEDYKGKLNTEETLKDYMSFNEWFSRKFMKMYLYSYLGHDIALKDDTFQTNLDKIQNLQFKLSQVTSYISPELASNDDYFYLELLKKEDFKDHRLGFESIIQNKKHVLSEIEERALSITSSYDDGFSDIYDTLIDTNLKFNTFTVDGKEYKLNDELYGLYMSDKNREVREKAYTGLYEVYKQFSHTFSKLFVYHLKQGSADLALRNHDSYLSAVLKGSRIPEGVYYNLVNQVNNNVDVMKEYFKLLKDESGIEDFKYYDSYISISSLDKKFDYETQFAIVKDALALLGDEYVSLLDKAYNERWIDVYPSDTKSSGGYQFGSYDTHPYIFLNNTDDYNSMSTLAHEAGHAMHSYYSNHNQPYETSGYAIYVAEVASTVNEILLNKYMLENSKDIDDKIYYLDRYIKNIKSTVFRQTMFSEFEERMHALIEEEVPVNLPVIKEEYRKLLDKHFGGVIEVDDLLEHEWIRISHFYRPFYVYKYATSFTSANYIATCILEDKNNMREKYFELLKSGGCDYPDALLKKVGVDLESEEPFNILFDDLKNAISQLKELLNEKKNLQTVKASKAR